MTILNPFTGETTFQFGSYAGINVNLIIQLRSELFSTIPMHYERERWIARLFLLPGRYAFRIEAGGVIREIGVAVIRMDYRELPEMTLKFLALTHTCLCDAHKLN